MEYCEKGSLHDILKNGKLKEQSSKKIMVGLLKGVKYLHLKDIIHWDLKPSNVLVWKGEVKICDFGLAIKAGKYLYEDLN